MVHPRLAGVGAVALFVAVGIFVVTFAMTVAVPGTAYDWRTNLVSDLGDPSCRMRAERWVCSPGHQLFNRGLIVTGIALAVVAACLRRPWGRLLAGSVLVMGLGLVVVGVVPPGDDLGIHLIGVVLALVVPGLGLVVSAIRPGRRWLRPHRWLRGLLGVLALIFCLESRLPRAVLPRGAGELIIIGSILLALLLEAGRVLRALATDALEPRPEDVPVVDG